jgi:hypothetical protein
MEKTHSIVLFNQKQIRRFYDEEKELWYFSIIDIVEILTDSSIPRRYWSDLKGRLKNEGSNPSVGTAHPTGYGDCGHRDTRVGRVRGVSVPGVFLQKPGGTEVINKN